MFTRYSQITIAPPPPTDDPQRPNLALIPLKPYTLSLASPLTPLLLSPFTLFSPKYLPDLSQILGLNFLELSFSLHFSLVYLPELLSCCLQ